MYMRKQINFKITEKRKMEKRKTGNKNNTCKTLLQIKKDYEKYFLKTALLLCLYQIKYRMLSGIANFIFSGKKQKSTKFLRRVNKSLNKNLCKCQATGEKCEYYRQKIEMIQSFG